MHFFKKLFPREPLYLPAAKYRIVTKASGQMFLQYFCLGSWKYIDKDGECWEFEIEKATFSSRSEIDCALSLHKKNQAKQYQDSLNEATYEYLS